MENLGQTLPDPALERLGNVSFRHVYLILAVIPNWVKLVKHCQPWRGIGKVKCHQIAVSFLSCFIAEL